VTAWFLVRAEAEHGGHVFHRDPGLVDAIDRVVPVLRSEDFRLRRAAAKATWAALQGWAHERWLWAFAENHALLDGQPKPDYIPLLEAVCDVATSSEDPVVRALLDAAGDPIDLQQR